MAEPRVSFIVRCKNKRATIEAAFASIRRQTVPAELVVVDSGSGDGTLAIAREWADVVVQMRPGEFTFGRALNLGASVASCEIHAALSAHAVLPAPDWLARVLEHLEDERVAGASGSGCSPDGQTLLEPFYQGFADWTPGWGFTNTASAWRARVWEEHRFDERMTASEDKEWAQRVLRAGWLLALDPFLVVSVGHRLRSGVRDLVRRTSAETRELVLQTGMPPFTAREAARTWWSDVVIDDHTPRVLQRLNYFRMAEIGGRYLGSRQASRAGRSLVNARVFARSGPRAR
jgi:rhamnosyltransferase